MPNGRSGGFVIEKADLKHLVKALPDTKVVARIMFHSSPPRAADAAEITRFVEECPNDRIAVEEQDHECYIIHLSNGPQLMWVVALSKTPMFLELRQRHERWTTEHPDWKEWISF